jgi:hypothetical protein
MKKLLFLSAAFIISANIMAQATKVDEVAKFNEEKHDFGKVKQGVPAITYFEITNSSSKPIVLESATASCGCTTPEWSKEPIAPGATSKIKVGYNAAGMGHFDKTVTIKVAGVTEAKVLTITGEVVADAGVANAAVKTTATNTNTPAPTNTNTNTQSKSTKTTTTKPKTTTTTKEKSN